MNRAIIIASALLSIGAAGFAAAQSAPPATDPAQSGSTPSQQQTPRSSHSTNSADKRAQMKECVAQLHRANSGMTEKDIGDYCKSQVGSGQPDGPQ